MLRAVVTLSGDSLVNVRLQTAPPSDQAEADASADDEAADEAADGDEHAETELDAGPSPIAPEVKELVWGIGAFVVLAVVLRYVIWPKLSEGIAARYDSIQQGHTDAEQLRADAEGEVAAYESALAEVRQEAAGRVDAARQTLEAERAERIAAANAEIGDRKAAALAEVDAARQAAAGDVNDAAGTVAAQIVERLTGTTPSADAVGRAVDSATVGASS